MIYELEATYEEGKPSDEQTACIETFFDSSNEFWKASGLTTDTGSDEETQAMINFFLGALAGDIPEPILKMVTDWKDEGF